jgi:tol-pal system protein YbgF
MKYLPLLLIGLVMVGCASSGDVTQVRQDMNTVYSEQAAYQDRTNSRLARLERDSKELQKNLSSLDGGMRKQIADMSVGEENRDEKLRGILGRLDELDSQIRTYWDQMRGEIREIKKVQDEIRRAKEREDAAGKTAIVTPPVPKLNPEEAYKQGFEAFQKGAYDDAIRLFTQLVKQNPDDVLTPNAYFWTGEGYMNLKDYEKAVVQYQELLDRFPRSDKAARSMFRQGEAFAALGDKKSSTTLMKRVVELFPNSEEARAAQRRLRGGTLQ